MSYTTVRIDKEIKDKIDTKGSGNNFNERLRDLLEETKLHEHFLTKKEIEKLIDKKIQRVTSY